MSEDKVDIESIPSWDLALWRDAAKKLDEQLAVAKDNYEKADKRFYERINLHRGDVAKIGEALIKEANSHSWCSEYDELIDELNTELSEPLPIRTRFYDVVVMVTRVQSQAVTIQVESTNDRHAIELAEGLFYEDPDLYLSDYDWDSNDEYETSVEECDEV